MGRGLPLLVCLLAAASSDPGAGGDFVLPNLDWFTGKPTPQTEAEKASLRDKILISMGKKLAVVEAKEDKKLAQEKRNIRGETKAKDLAMANKEADAMAANIWGLTSKMAKSIQSTPAKLTHAQQLLLAKKEHGQLSGFSAPKPLRSKGQKDFLRKDSKEDDDDMGLTALEETVGTFEGKDHQGDLHTAADDDGIHLHTAVIDRSQHVQVVRVHNIQMATKSDDDDEVTSIEDHSGGRRLLRIHRLR
jgi:hypothetical protein